MLRIGLKKTSVGGFVGGFRSRGILCRSTTILCIRRDKNVLMIGDGQVSMGSTVAKTNAVKVHSLVRGKVIAGFAGAAADGLTLLDRLETSLDSHFLETEDGSGLKLKSDEGILQKACVEVAKLWRTDQVLRRLDAILIVSDVHHTLILSGGGEVMEPQDGVAGVGSGGDYAAAAARALFTLDTSGSPLSLEQIGQTSMKVASDTCVYTNHQYVMQSLGDIHMKPESK